MREKQRTLVERMKPIFPRITQPVVSAARDPVQSGVQFTNRLRRAAGWEPEHRDLDRRYNFRLFPDEGDFFSTIAYSKSLKRNVRLVVFMPAEGKQILYFSTDTDMSAKNVVEFYRTRFQIEFCYRDGKQSSGLCYCQPRDFAKLDFAFNSSLTAVNVAKVVVRQNYPRLSIANLKSLLYNCYLTKRFFAMSGFRPNMSINANIFKELYDIAACAA